MPSYIHKRGPEITVGKIFAEHEQHAARVINMLDKLRRGKTDAKTRQDIPDTQLIFEQTPGDRVEKGLRASIRILAKVTGEPEDPQLAVGHEIMPVFQSTHISSVEKGQPVRRVVALGGYDSSSARPTHFIEAIGARGITSVKFSVGRLTPTVGRAQPGQVILPANRQVQFLTDPVEANRVIETANLIPNRLEMLEWMAEGADYYEALAESAKTFEPVFVNDAGVA